MRRKKQVKRNEPTPNCKVGRLWSRIKPLIGIESDTEIASRFGLTSAAISYWRKRMGVSRAAGPKSKTLKIVKKIKEMRRKGITLRKIAESIGVTMQRVHQLCRLRG